MFFLRLGSDLALSIEQQQRLIRLQRKRPDLVAALVSLDSVSVLSGDEVVIHSPTETEVARLQAWGGGWHVFLPGAELEQALDYIRQGAAGVLSTFDALLAFLEDEQTLETAVRVDLAALYTLTALFDELSAGSRSTNTSHLKRLCELLEVDFVALVLAGQELELAFRPDSDGSDWGDWFGDSRPPYDASDNSSQSPFNRTLLQLPSHPIWIEDVLIEECPGPNSLDARLVAGRIRGSRATRGMAVSLLPLAARLQGQQLQRSWLLSRVLNAKREWEGTVDTIPDPIVLLDLSGQILRGNQALADLVGRDVREVSGTLASTLLGIGLETLPGGFFQGMENVAASDATNARHPTSEQGSAAEALSSDLNSMLNSAPRPTPAGALPGFESGEAELWLPIAPDRTFKARCYSLPVVREEGMTQEVLVYLRDITEEKRLLSIIGQQERYAAFGELAEMLFHDFGSPIGALQVDISYLHGVLPEVVDAARQHAKKYKNRSLEEQLKYVMEGLDDIMMCSQRLSQMSSTLQQYRRLGAGRGAEMLQVDLNVMLSTLPRLYQSLARSKRIEVRTELKSLAPILGHSHELMRVFENLIKNAIEAQPAGGEILLQAETLSTGPSPQGSAEEVVVRITDQGHGIAADVLPHIFERGFTTRMAVGGTGLGLYVSRQIILQHGGAIQVASVEGKGTSFTIVLPAMPELE